jgi:hypothetical protein
VRIGQLNLLYAGAHFGLFASFDGGGHWLRVGDLPNVRVDDLQIHRARPTSSSPRTGGASTFSTTLDLPRVDTGGSQTGTSLTIAPARGFYLLSGFVGGTGKGRFAEKIRRRALC